MKLVAFDYLTKPFGNDELLPVDSCALEDFQLRHEVRRLRGELARSYGLPNIIAADPKMIAVLDLMNSIVQTSRFFFGSPPTVCLPCSNSLQVSGQSGGQPRTKAFHFGRQY
jgi:hypothetical protein